MAKKYYWLKLKEDFFRNKKIKKLRKIAGGDTYTVIYLKMQLLSLQNEGTLIYEGVEESFAEEIALEIDEDIDNVKITLSFLSQNGLLEEISQDHFIMTETVECIGSEGSSAERVRRHRALKQQKVLQCNAPVTIGNTEIDIEKEKDIDLDKKKDKEKDLEIEFEELWSKYPNKKDKSKALKYYKDARKKGTTKEEVSLGIDNYNKEISIKKTEKKYIKHGSTWFNNKCWQDEYDFTPPANNNNRG